MAIARRGAIALVACSALRRVYRERLAGGRDDVRFVYLRGDYDVIASRLAGRIRSLTCRWSLLASQFRTLEEPGSDENPLVLSIDEPVERLVEEIAANLFIIRPVKAQAIRFCKSFDGHAHRVRPDGRRAPSSCARPTGSPTWSTRCASRSGSRGSSGFSNGRRLLAHGPARLRVVGLGGHRLLVRGGTSGTWRRFVDEAGPARPFTLFRTLAGRGDRHRLCRSAIRKT
jgi:hypothetical protein